MEGSDVWRRELDGTATVLVLAVLDGNAGRVNAILGNTTLAEAREVALHNRVSAPGAFTPLSYGKPLVSPGNHESAQTWDTWDLPRRVAATLQCA